MCSRLCFKKEAAVQILEILLIGSTTLTPRRGERPRRCPRTAKCSMLRQPLLCQVPSRFSLASICKVSQFVPNRLRLREEGWVGQITNHKQMTGIRLVWRFLLCVRHVSTCTNTFLDSFRWSTMIQGWELGEHIEYARQGRLARSWTSIQA